MAFLCGVGTILIPQFLMEGRFNMRKAIYIGLICTFIVVVLLAWIYNNPIIYEHNYWSKIGIPRGHTYKDVVEQKGVPTTEKHIEDYSYVEYDGLLFVFPQGFNGIFIRAEVTTSKYKFGIHKIGVGSDREDVEKAYRGMKKIKDLPTDEFGYIDNGIWIIFKEDMNGIVERIIISRSV